MPKLSCRELIDFLDDYVAGTLPVSRRTLFDDHLSRCTRCVRYLRGYQGTMRAMALAFGPEERAPKEVPEELVSAILAARRS